MTPGTLGLAGLCALPSVFPPSRSSLGLDLPPPPPGAEKALHDAYGDWGNTRTTDNFALKWGPDTLDEDWITHALDTLESSRAFFVLDRGYDEPLDGGSYLVNVYVSDTGYGDGPDDPSTIGAAAYYTRDPDGFPMIVLDGDVVGRTHDQSAQTIVHELFHAFQDATGHFDGWPVKPGWWWEATAEWATGQADPYNSAYAQLLPYYLEDPELPYRTTDAFGHEYGAFILPHHVSEVAGPDVIDRLWQESTADDPLLALADALDDLGIALDDEFVSMAARTTLLDFDNESIVDNAAGTVWSFGTVAKGIEPDAYPGAYGYWAARLILADAEEVSFRIDGDTWGTEGSPAELRPLLALENGEGPTYVPLELGVEASVDVTDVDRAYLVVASVSPSLDLGERFPFAVDVAVLSAADLPEDEPDAEPAARRGCQHAPPATGSAIVAWLLLLARRRNGRQDHPHST